MPRLRLAVAVLLSAQTLRAETPVFFGPNLDSPARGGVLAAAESQVAAGCKAAPPSCAELKAVHAGYLAVLSALAGCPSKDCGPELLGATFRADEELDRRESLLPDAARSDGVRRPLLRLSLVVSKEAAAALAAVSPQAKLPFRYDPPVDGPKAVEAVCLETAAACADARGALEAALAVDRAARACEAAACAFEALDSAAARAENAMGGYERASTSSRVDLLPLFSLVKQGEDRLVVLLRGDAARKADALDADLADLSADVEALSGGGGDAVAAEAKFNRASETYREASLGVDRVASFLLRGEYGAAERARLNADAARLASLRSRLLAAQTTRGLAVDRSAQAIAAPAAAAASARAAPSGLAAAGAPTLLDRRTIPAPPPRRASAPPILPGEPTAWQVARNVFSDDPLKRADARRRAGLSETVGDPEGRARLVHSQQYGDTCAIVSQQEVLTAMRLVSGEDPKRTETDLRGEAARRGFYRSGTPDDYSADLLVDRGVLVSKQARAPLAELDAAVRRGGLVIASVDARYLWPDMTAAKNVLGHAIVITGAEIDRFGGGTAGYYINDSGTDPPGRGRFVPIEAFRKAWESHTRSFAEFR